LRGLARTAIALLGAIALAPAASAEVFIAVDKTAQRMSVSVDGVERYSWPVSTGTAGYATPTGAFTPVRLAREHYSREWDNAPMPHSIFFTPDGHAIHGSPATGRLGMPASHGCVRLSPAHASTLFDLVQATGPDRTRIEVTGVEPIGTGLAGGYGAGHSFRGLTNFDPMAAGIMADGRGTRQGPELRTRP
jgi:L,D-transpeptidase catalytic domain